MFNEEEVVQSIKEKMPDFAILPSDLKAPTARFVQSYFVRVLEELGVDVDSIKQHTSQQLQEIAYPDAYRHVLPVTNLYAVVSLLFKHIFVDDFSLSDLIEPGVRRTQYLIKTLDMFHTYADWKAQSVQANVTKLLQRKREYNKLKSTYEEMREKLNRRARERAQETNRRKELRDRMEQMSRMLVELKTQDTEVQKDIMLAQTVVQEEKHKLGKLQAEYQKLDTQFVTLESQVVKSPTHLEAELTRLRDTKKKCEADEQQLALQIQEKNRQKDLYKKFIDMQLDLNVRLNDIIAFHTQYRAEEELWRSLLKREQECTTDIKEFEEKMEKLRSKEVQLNEQLETIHAEWEKKRAALVLRRQEVEQEQEQLQGKSDEVNSEVTHIRSETLNLEEKFTYLLERNDFLNKEYEELYARKTAHQDAIVEKLQDLLEKFAREVEGNKE